MAIRLALTENMTPMLPDATPTIQYSAKAVERARQAIACSPFRLKLLTEMRSESVAIAAVTDAQGIHNGYTQRPLSELAADGELMWLIQVGLLRREVDGQGLTDSFRLTPLGRQLVDRLTQKRFPDSRPSLSDQIYNALNRWWRLPDWLQ